MWLFFMGVISIKLETNQQHIRGIIAKIPA